MSSHSGLERHSLQQFLASAFAVQESQMDSQFLAGMVEVQRMVTRGELGVDAAMNLVVDSARDIAGADGIAICLLEAEQLIYRAASGCSTGCIGSRVTASLTVPTNTQANGEILRVENAQTDTRIQAAICRQFGANSLLILPVYHDRILAGVFEVLFNAPHCFQEGEVHSYRLMAGLIETAMSHTAEAEEKNHMAALAATAGTSLWQGFLNTHESVLEKSKHAIYRHCGTALSAVKKSQLVDSLKRPSLLRGGIVNRARGIVSKAPPWNVALATIATVLGATFWIAYGRGPASPSRSSATPVSTSSEPEERFAPTSVSRSVSPKETSEGSGASLALQPARLSGAAIRRPLTRDNDVVYIGDDVTVRHFTHQPKVRRRAVGGPSRVANIGDDVTVRYFTAKPPAKVESR
jgi:hypothetical protein